MSARESLLSKALGRFGLNMSGSEKRSSLENPQTPLSYPAEWLLDIFNGGRTDSGIRVSEMTALQVAAVFQCVTIIANGIAAHPLNVYLRQLESGRIAKKIAFDHPLFEILHSEPNPEMTSSTWRRTLQVHKLLWGNAYCEIERSKTNKIIALWPRNPARTRPVRLLAPMEYEGDVLPTGTMMYETFEDMHDSQLQEQDSMNQKFAYRRLVLAEDMLHLPGLSLDGRIGQDVIILARQAVGLALSSEKYAAKYFGNGAIPGGVLTAPGDMTDIQWETLKRSWQEAHGGENMHRPGVLPPGVTYNKIGSHPSEGQMTEARETQIAEVARFFNVPPHMLGINADDAGKSSVEQSSIEFKLFCLDPHVCDWEQEFKRKLFPSSTTKGPNKYVAGFDMRKLMYPDAASRSQFYGNGKQWGYLNTNDIHELEGMNPVEDGSGDAYWMPNNMVDAAMAAQHSDAVTQGLSDGTLAATPSNVTPVGSHPIVKDQQKQAKIAAAAQLEQSKIQANKEVKIAKANATNQDSNQTDDEGNTPQPKNKSKKRSEMVRVFTTMYRDAAGRAANRKKATAGDYLAIFGPVVATMVDYTFGGDASSGNFIDGYTSALFGRRNEQWGENLDEASTTELQHLVDALLRNL